MRKFKLIKEYPGSGVEGATVEFNIGPSDDIAYSGTGKCPTFNEASNCPEYWQEIIEKDYEILSFIDKINNNRIYKQDKEDKNFFSALNFGNTLWTANNLISSIDIHSVKRLSDGEIFTIGDRVTNKPSIGTIISFSVMKDHLRVSFNNKIGHTNCWINFIKHSKKPLFTTEDGVEIFEGDKYHNVYFSGHLPKGVSYFQLLGPHKATSCDYGESYTSDCKFFSTEEAALEYILNNKPCLSLNDIKNKLKGKEALTITGWQQLISLVRNKLDL